MKPWTALLSFSCLLLFVGGHLVNGEDNGDNSSNNQIRRTQHQHLQRQRERPLKSFVSPTPSPTFWITMTETEWPTSSPTSPCEGPDPQSCGCPQVNQEDYRGTISKTSSGRTCQNWADQTPHWHSLDPANFPESGLDANYCRNPWPRGYVRAWCYTMDPDVRWEYCDVPFCLSPTISPAPTLTKLPSESPTMSVPPSSLPSSSGSPTMSASPSTLPSVSPTYTGGCMNLSIAVLFPAKTFTELSFNLRVNTTTSDGTEIMWEIPYYVIYSYYDVIDTKSNSIAVEHANGTNSLDEEICLPAGRYSFGYSNMEAYLYSGTRDLLTYSENGWGVRRTMFVLLSGDQTIACGDLGVEPFDDRVVSFDLPLMQEEDSMKCSGGINDILTPMQCYQRAFNFTSTFDFAAVYDGYYIEKEEINRDVWFNEEVGSILSNACKNRMDTLGFDDAMGEAFCAYFECAYPDPEGTYPSCECLYHEWDCNHGSGCGEGDAALECCESGGNDCHCVLMKDECDDGLGDVNKCTDYANHCCLDGDDECNCKYKRPAVLDSIQQNKDLVPQFKSPQFGDDMFGDDIFDLLGRLDESCFGCDYSSFGICEGACTYWEKVCVENPGGICEYAADNCCSPSDIPCVCDFTDHIKATNGYNGYDFDSGCIVYGSPTLQEEKERLIEIYERNNGKYWINNEGWITTNTSQCDWYGITCDSEGYIQAIDLSFNNVTGSFPSYVIPSLSRLESLKMSGNKLYGNIDRDDFYRKSSLRHIDLSLNDLSGNAQLLLSPSIREVNISHNKFTSIEQFREWKSGYNSLVSADVSHNDINQDCSEVLTIVPPNIRILRFNDNSIHGQLPSSLPILEELRELFINNNHLSGAMPPISASLPMIEYLNLANQTDDDNTGLTGLTGPIPSRWSNLLGLKLLDLSCNRLTKNIPADLASLPSLEILNVSHNMLGYLPKEFGKLAANLFVLDASYNRLEGRIPVPEFTSAAKGLNGVIKLSGNTNISSPAPLSLCSLAGFDLKDDSRLCPVERRALKDFYHSVKGAEWTDAENWLSEYELPCNWKGNWKGITCDASSEYELPCNWKGIKCNENLTIIGLNLTHNSLSGKLSSSISELRSLEILDLSDNDIQGTIPDEIGLLLHLTTVRLSNNAFSLAVPSTLGNLTHLNLLHLHGNRFSGVMPDVDTTLLKETSAFIADCGLPSEFESALECDDCSMCCEYCLCSNSNSECHETKPDQIQAIGRKGISSYAEFSWVLLVVLLGFIFLLVTASYIYDLCRDRGRSTGHVPRRASIVARDSKYAIGSIGEDSVYQYFLGKSILGWIVAASVVTVQIVALSIFVKAAVKDFTNDASDFIYS
ncbi:hypothetical protein ACHAWC_007673 [Mediolabrus comicus]